MSIINLNGQLNIKGSNVLIGDVVNSKINFSENEKEIIKPLIEKLTADKQVEAIEALNTLSNSENSESEKISAGKLLLELLKGVASSIGENSTNSIIKLVVTNAPTLLEFTKDIFPV